MCDPIARNDAAQTQPTLAGPILFAADAFLIRDTETKDAATANAARAHPLVQTSGDDATFTLGNSVWPGTLAVRFIRPLQTHAQVCVHRP